MYHANVNVNQCDFKKSLIHLSMKRVLNIYLSLLLLMQSIKQALRQDRQSCSAYKACVKGYMGLLGADAIC